MNRETEKMFNQIRKIIEQKGLTNEDEIKKFMENEVIGKSLDDFQDIDNEVSDEDFAKDLVNDAMHTKNKFEAITLAEDALAHDKNCIEAYIFLSSTQEHPFLMLHFLKMAVKIGKKKFPKEFLKENKEHLWYIHETRPYLTAMFVMGQVYFEDEDYASAIQIFDKLIEICPNDNLGARDLLMTALLRTEEYEQYKKYEKMYPEEESATALFNKVLYSYYNDDDKEKTSYLLKAAQKINPHVVKKLINSNLKLKLSSAFGMGSPEEANNYCYFARDMWLEDKDLIRWIKQNQ